MSQKRPNPDALLKQVKAEEARQLEGKLKVFFGANPGVGKTYAMLEAAHEQRHDGVDVVIGVVETHGRAETEALVKGLEVLPRRTVDYRGTALQEFDLDAALTRRPTVILIDELAHTNAPGLRHAKRWQDVQELLKAGITVYATVNVQHLESLNDVVAQITGVRVRETVPDSVIERADDVELIDLPPDDLLQRLKDGKVYVPEQIQHAIQNFFTKGNLIALRELALRRTAERVDQQMEVYRRDHAVIRTWPAAETIMVCVNMKPRGPRLIRAARQMAADLHAKWIAVYVQIPRHLRLPQVERDRLVQTLRLAEQLGAETVTLTGERIAQELLSYARSRNATKIIVGKPVRSLWKEWMFGSVVSELVHQSGDIDIYVITGEAGEGQPLMRRSLKRSSKLSEYAYAAAGVSVATAVAWAMFPYFGPANLIMMYLIAVIFIAIRLGRGPSVLASVLSVATFDFFFVPPYFSFAVSDIQYLLTFAVMLVVALVISNLAVRIREQAELARYRERRTGVLYTMSRDLATHRGTGMLTQVAAKHLREVFDGQVAIFLADAEKRVRLQRAEQLYFELDPKGVRCGSVGIRSHRAGRTGHRYAARSQCAVSSFSRVNGSDWSRGGPAERHRAVTGSRSTSFARIAREPSRLGDRTNSSLGGGTAGSRASGNGTYAQCHSEFGLSRLANSTGHHHRSRKQFVGRAEPTECDRSSRTLSIHLPGGGSPRSALEELARHDADRSGGRASQ